MSGMLFLSHAGADSDRALALAAAIEASPDAQRLGISVWIDKLHLKPGTPWQEQLEEAIEKRSTAFGLLLTREGARNWVRMEVRVALDRVVAAQREGGHYKFIPIIVDDLADIGQLPAFARQYQGVRLAPGIAGVAKLIQLLGDVNAEQPIALVSEPFMGLDAFEARDAALFFGRGKEVHDLVQRLKRTNFAIVAGDSGCGKSSLVRAGLVPAFREGAFADALGRRPDPSEWHVVEMRPGTDPFDGLVEGIARAAKAAGVAPEMVMAFGKAVRSRDAGLIRDALRESGPDTANLLLIVDQFEELWTQNADDARRRDFLAALLEIAPPGNLSRRVVCTMRRDYFHLCSDYPALDERLKADGRFLLGAMSREGLREAVEKPLLLAGESEVHATALANAVLLDVTDQSGNLALLEMALTEAWRRRALAGGDILRAYDGIGRLEGALATAAEDVFENRDGDPERLLEIERPLAEALFMRLVRAGDGGSATRRIVRPAELNDATWCVAQKLASKQCRRLVVLGGQSDEKDAVEPRGEQIAPSIELAHEQLVTQWSRYQRWLRRSDEDPNRAIHKRALDRLMDRTERWATTGRDDDLAIGGDLDDFVALGERRASWLSGLEREFVSLSEETRRGRVREEEERRDRERRGLQALQISESLRLATEARQAADREPETALRVAWEAVLWDRNELSESVFRETLERMPAPVKLIRHGGRLDRGPVGFAADGSFLYATDNEHGAIETWQADGTSIARFDLPDKGRWAIAAMPDRPALLIGRGGRLMLFDVAGQDLGVVVLPQWVRARYLEPDCRLTIARESVALFQQGALAWLIAFGPTAKPLQVRRVFKLVADTPENAEVWPDENDPLHRPYSHVHSIALDAARRRFLSNGSDGTIRCWTFDGELHGILQCDKPSEFHNAEFLSEARVAAGTLGGAGHLWTDQGDLLGTFRPQAGTDLFVRAVDPSGEYFVTALNHGDGALEVWDASGVRQVTLAADGQHYWSAAFSPDGRYVAAGCAGGAVRVWEWREQRLAFELHGHIATTNAVAFCPGDGASLLSSDHDGSVRLWALDAPILPRLRGHTGAVRHMTRLGQHMLTSGADDTTLLWSEGKAAPLTGAALTTMPGLSPPNTLLTEDRLGSVRLWQWQDQASIVCRCILPSAVRGGERINGAGVAPDGSRFVLTYDQQAGGTAELWGADGERLATLVGPKGPGVDADRARIVGLGFQASTGAIVTGAQNGTVWLWSTNGKLVASFVVDTASPDRLFDLTVDPLGEFILVGIRSEATLWNWKGEKICTLPTLGYKVLRVAISPDGTRLLTVSDNPSGQPSHFAQWWDRQGRLLARLDAPGVTSWSVANAHFDVGGRYVLLRTNELRIYDPAGALIGVLAAARDVGINDVAVSPDGELVLALFSDGIARIWSFEARRRVMSIRISAAGRIAFSVDGSRLLAAMTSGSIEQIALNIADLYAGAAERLDRGFSIDEVQRFAIQEPAKLKLANYSKIQPA